jgi:pimeloyl-ACP methyl ester carboxylesterase
MNTLDPPLQHIAIENETIAYRTCGNELGPTLVLIHGLAETSAYFWRTLLPHLVDRYHVIAFDLLGHGDSSCPVVGYSVQRQLRIYAQFLQAVCRGPVMLLGHSLGGVISANLAINYPHLVSKVILYDVPIPRGPLKNVMLAFDMHPIAVLALSPFTIPGFGLFLDRFAPRRLQRHAMRHLMRIWRVPYDPAHYNPDMEAYLSRTQKTGIEQQLRYVFLFHDLQSQLEKVQQPTLQILGENDVLHPVERAREICNLMPNCCLATIPQAGHLAMFDNPTAFLEELLPFLEKRVVPLEYAPPLWDEADAS